MSGAIAVWLLGVTCLAFMGGYAVYALWATIAPNRAKIAAALAPALPRVRVARASAAASDRKGQAL